MFLSYFIQKYLRTSIRTSEAEIAKKIRTSRLSEKRGVLIRKKGVRVVKINLLSQITF